MVHTRRPDPGIFLGGAGPNNRWLGIGPGSVRQGERPLAPAQALAAVRGAVLGRSVVMSSVQALLARAGVVGSLTRTSGEQWRALEAALRRGVVVVVERPRALSRLGHEQLHADAVPAAAADDAPIVDLDGGHTLALRVIETTARPVAQLALALTLEAADGSSQAANTSSAGVIQLDDVRPGTWGCRIASVDAVAWDTDWDREGEWEREGLDGQRVGFVSLDLQGCADSELRVLSDVPNSVVIERPVLRRVTPDFMRFDNESAILVPAPWTGSRHPLAGVVHALVELLDDPARWLLVVGHASAPGSDARNQALSEHRADAIRALVEGESAAWVEHARKRGSLRDVIAYLVYLAGRRGWPCSFEAELESMSRDETEPSRACVQGFQAEYNARFAGELAVDGVCGRKTLGAVFEVLRDELQRWLAKLGATLEALPLERVVYVGHGSTLAPRGQADEAEDRVLDLILVDRLPLATDIDPAEVYDSEVAWRLALELPDEPDEWATGPLTIVTDLSPEEPHEPETYRLSSEDGSVSFERCLPDDAVVEAGEFVLHFEALPTQHRYTLIVVGEGDSHSVIFEQLGYGALHGCAPPRG